MYALAFVCGEYNSPSGSMREECYSVIYFRHSDTEHPFCRMSVNAEGRFFSYSNPDVTNVDQILMLAWDEDGIHPAEWTLYGEQSEGIETEIADPAIHRAYLAVARRAAETIQLLYVRRWARGLGEAEAQKRGQTLNPLFRFQSGRQQSALYLLTRFAAQDTEPPGTRCDTAPGAAPVTLPAGGGGDTT